MVLTLFNMLVKQFPVGTEQQFVVLRVQSVSAKEDRGCTFYMKLRHIYYLLDCRVAQTNAAEICGVVPN
jgi:hypothetical protein